MPAVCSEVVTFPLTVQGPAAGDARTAASVRVMGDGLNQRIRFLLWTLTQVSFGGTLLSLFGSIAPLGGIPTPITSINTTTGVFTLVGHGFNSADPFRRMPGAAATTFPGITPSQSVYYVVAVDADHFKITDVAGNAALTGFSGGMTGEWYAVKVSDGFGALFAPTVGDVVGGSLRSVVAFLAAAQTFTGYQTFNGGAAFGNTAVFTAPQQRTGATARLIKRAPVVVPDADTTIDTSEGDVFVLSANTTQRTLRLRQTTAPVPFIGESLRVVFMTGSSGSWIVKREGASGAMVTFATAGGHQSADFEVRDAGGAVPHWTVAATTIDTGSSSIGADAD